MACLGRGSRRLCVTLLLSLLPLACGDGQGEDEGAGADTDHDALRKAVNEAIEDPAIREELKGLAEKHPEQVERTKRWLKGDDQALPEDLVGLGAPPVQAKHWWGGSGGVPGWAYAVFGLAGIIVAMCLIDLIIRGRRFIRRLARG